MSALHMLKPDQITLKQNNELQKSAFNTSITFLN